jgi:hypothetical protein
MEPDNKTEMSKTDCPFINGYIGSTISVLLSGPLTISVYRYIQTDRVKTAIPVFLLDPTKNSLALDHSILDILMLSYKLSPVLT